MSQAHWRAIMTGFQQGKSVAERVWGTLAGDNTPCLIYVDRFERNNGLKGAKNAYYSVQFSALYYSAEMTTIHRGSHKWGTVFSSGRHKRRHLWGAGGEITTRGGNWSFSWANSGFIRDGNIYIAVMTGIIIIRQEYVEQTRWTYFKQFISWPVISRRTTSRKSSPAVATLMSCWYPLMCSTDILQVTDEQIIYIMLI